MLRFKEKRVLQKTSNTEIKIIEEPCEHGEETFNLRPTKLKLNNSVEHGDLSCTIPGCVKSFRKPSTLEQHLAIGQHIYHENDKMTDVAMEVWAEKCTHGTNINYNEQQDEDNIAIGADFMDMSSNLKSGWALKSERKFVRERTGKKANPLTVANKIRNEKNDAGGRLFAPDDWVTAQQVRGVFAPDDWVTAQQVRGVFAPDDWVTAQQVRGVFAPDDWVTAQQVRGVFAPDDWVTAQQVRGVFAPDDWVTAQQQGVFAPDDWVTAQQVRGVFALDDLVTAQQVRGVFAPDDWVTAQQVRGVFVRDDWVTAQQVRGVFAPDDWVTAQQVRGVLASLQLKLQKQNPERPGLELNLKTEVDDDLNEVLTELDAIETLNIVDSVTEQIS
ncbi:unnamed protein product [Mytilus coruscus]|uniref:C2H2-type domain-containing protein n=1 Tax=Mytilus coruscus TaxID=42192 RepID=A0A6J8BBB2_MYTCO|nr:unnamed protein product [Mytilus coruscus]